MEPCAYQHEPVEQVCYELTYKSIQADCRVRKYALFLLYKSIPLCRSPPLVLRFQSHFENLEDKHMSKKCIMPDFRKMYPDASEEVIAVLRQTERKMQYQEYDLKSEHIRVNQRNKAVT